MGRRDLYRWPQTADNSAIDQARHRASVLAWLRQRGYTDLAPVTTPKDVLVMTERAGITEADLRRPMRPDFEEEGMATKPELQWLKPGEEPPPARNGHTCKYAEVAEQLRQQPGRWALMAVPRGSIQALRRHGIEATQRRNGTAKEPRVYVRWPA